METFATNPQHQLFLFSGQVPEKRTERLFISDKNGLAKSIFEQTGWSGALPVSICQDTDILLSIYEYDYDLNNHEFEKYCRERFGFRRADDPAYFDHLCDYKMTKEEYFDYWRILANMLIDLAESD